MKKLLYFIVSCIVVCMLFSSCSNLYIAKRHYRGGYYINYAKSANSTGGMEANTTRKKMPLVSLPYISAQRSIKGINQTPDFSNLATSNPVAAINEKNRHKTIPLEITKQPLVPIAINTSESREVQDKVASSEGSAGYDDGAGRAALSLLWIVIVVVLILWLIGLLAGGFGLGGLINILLIIAVILLILWLLRIA